MAFTFSSSRLLGMFCSMPLLFNVASLALLFHFIATSSIVEIFIQTSK
jgi:hypothetical protein